MCVPCRFPRMNVCSLPKEGLDILIFNVRFSRRPRMMHPIHLVDDFKLTLKFSLKLVGQLNPLLHPFFESVNPGFKVYIGDYLMFDYVLSGQLDDVSIIININFKYD